MIIGEKPENGDSGRLASTSAAAFYTNPLIITGNANDPSEVKVPVTGDVPFREVGIARENADPGQPVGYHKEGILKLRASGAITISPGLPTRVSIDPAKPTKYKQIAINAAGMTETFSFAYALTTAGADGDIFEAEVDPQFIRTT